MLIPSWHICRCTVVIISSIPSLSLNSQHVNLSVTLTPHIHLIILISAAEASTHSLSSLVMFHCHVTYATDYAHSVRVIFLLQEVETSLLVNRDTSCLNLFRPSSTLVFTAAPADYVSEYLSILLIVCDPTRFRIVRLVLKRDVKLQPTNDRKTCPFRQ